VGGVKWFFVFLVSVLAGAVSGFVGYRVGVLLDDNRIEAETKALVPEVIQETGLEADAEQITLITEEVVAGNVDRIESRINEMEVRMGRIQERLSADGDRDLHKARAMARNVLLTDLDGREIRVEILSVQGGNASIRRVSDQREFDIPVAQLVEEDQEFLAYLETYGVPSPGGAFDSGGNASTNSEGDPKRIQPREDDSGEDGAIVDLEDFFKGL